MEIGAEWLVDAAGCLPTALVNVELMDDLFRRVIRDLDLHPLHEPRWHVFPPPGGVTGFVILTESHLACHTYPEHGILALNLYCCRPRPQWPWRERLAEMFGASRVEVRTIQRTADMSELALWQ
jgi:S-adenosylmethionine decarboxylase